MNAEQQAPPASVQRRIFELMVLMKAADDRLFKGVATGEFVCPLWPARGQEAIPAAFGVCLRPDDQLVTTYRGVHDMIGKGVPLIEILGEMLGRSVGASRGKGGIMHLASPDYGLMMTSGVVGGGVPVAVGLALSAKKRGLDRVTVASFGDGATNTGSFHEAANLAAVWDLPVVLLCQNNQYGEHTPTHHTMKVEHVAERAKAYGMPGIHVDGNDPLAVLAALVVAIDRARSGRGPTLLECDTFRFRGHSRGDNMAYIPKEQFAAAEKADPIPRFRDHLISSGISSGEELDAIENAARGTIDDIIERVNAAPGPLEDELARDVYGAPYNCPA